jgi:hypothetical protein
MAISWKPTSGPEQIPVCPFNRPQRVNGHAKRLSRLTRRPASALTCSAHTMSLIQRKSSTV